MWQTFKYKLTAIHNWRSQIVHLVCPRAVRSENNQKGFTLVEILVVMMILGVLSLLAISGYGSFRKNALLSLSADELVAQINELKSKTAYGDFGRERKEQILQFFADGTLAGASANPADCFGFRALISDGEFKLTRFSQKFSGKKIWQGNQWVYQGCDKNVENETELSLDRNLEFEALRIVAGDSSISTVGSELILRFLPPDGALEWSFDGNGFTQGNLEKVQFDLLYGSQNIDQEFIRTVDYEIK